jgi:hypothetical protein
MDKRIDTLNALVTSARAWGMQCTYLSDWPDVDVALEKKLPVILMGDAMSSRAHGKRLEMNAPGLNFLVLLERVSTVFPTSGGPFATETVSYLAHDPLYPKGPAWLCLGELRGYCAAIPDQHHLGISVRV